MTKPSPALIVATLALAVAATGTAGAAGLIDGHSIRNHSITANKLAKGAVTAPAVATHAITKSALADGVIVNNTVIAPVGPKGDAGDPGATIAGPPGAPGGNVVGTETVQAFNGGTSQSAVATCPAGKIVVSGGYEVNPGVVVSASHPWSGGVGWYVSTGGVTTTITAFVVCATAGN